MNVILFNTPAPSCLVPMTHPARAHIPASDTNVRRTFDEHSTLDLLDDYDLTSRTDYLEMPGAFQ